MKAKGVTRSGCHRTYASGQNRKHTPHEANMPQRQGVFGEVQGLSS